MSELTRAPDLIEGKRRDARIVSLIFFACVIAGAMCIHFDWDVAAAVLATVALFAFGTHRNLHGWIDGATYVMAQHQIERLKGRS